jgi:hypothetical protein
MRKLAGAKKRRNENDSIEVWQYIGKFWPETEIILVPLCPFVPADVFSTVFREDGLS